MRTRCACGNPVTTPRSTQCPPCKRAYMRQWRTRNVLSEIQREHDRARSYANVYKRRGRLILQPCEVGGDCLGPIVMHHDDYDLPLAVRWFCRKHHLALHGMQIGVVYPFVKRETLAAMKEDWEATQAAQLTF